MEISLSKSDLLSYVIKQLNNFFPDSNIIFSESLFFSFNEALERIEYCFKHVNNRYFNNEKNSIFNHLNGDQYSMFLYMFSNTIYRRNFDINIATKLFLLNKTLYGIDAYYEVCLPNIFLFVHPMGTVLGRGTYKDFLLVYQKCNIGSNRNVYPNLGEHLSLHPGASIIGNCSIGNNVKISLGSTVLDTNIEDNSLYIGDKKNFEIKKTENVNSIWKI